MVQASQSGRLIISSSVLLAAALRLLHDTHAACGTADDMDSLVILPAHSALHSSVQQSQTAEAVELGLPPSPQPPPPPPPSTVPTKSAIAADDEAASAGATPSTTATAAGMRPSPAARSTPAPWATQHPLDVAGPLSLLYLSCLDPLIALGARRPLQVRVLQTYT